MTPEEEEAEARLAAEMGERINAEFANGGGRYGAR